MKRVLTCLAATTFVLALGCGRSYEPRLQAYVARLEYLQRLDRLLMPAAASGFKDLGIFMRPPKPLELSKAFTLGETQGLFDLTSDFNDLKKGNEGLRLHVVARKEKDKTKKNAPAKNAPPPPDTSARGDFNADLLNLLSGSYGASDALSSPAWKNDKSGNNTFKRLNFTNPTNNNTVRVYVFKQKPYDVALIYEIPASLSQKGPEVASALPLSLESFAVGPKATRAFEGTVDEEVGPPGKGGADAPTQAF